MICRFSARCSQVRYSIARRAVPPSRPASNAPPRAAAVKGIASDCDPKIDRKDRAPWRRLPAAAVWTSASLPAGWHSTVIGGNVHGSRDPDSRMRAQR
jgi:hypothetical protein